MQAAMVWKLDVEAHGGTYFNKAGIIVESKY